MTRRLPPLNGLRAFEAAARHLSFKKAAEELNVTAAAISQHIRALEEYTGVRLFERKTRALKLTESGEDSLPLLSEGFDLLARSVERMSAVKRTRVITVSVAPSFGAKWLVPRLERFRDTHPEFDILIDATNDVAHFTGDGVDVALRYGRGSYRNLVSECLFDSLRIPVCSPAILDGRFPLERPEDLRHYTLLHVDWRTEPDEAPNWRMWLRAAGVTDLDTERGPRFSVESMAVQSAIQGQGILLIDRVLVEDDLRDGRLVELFTAMPQLTTLFHYYVVYPEDKADDPKVCAFRNWVFSEAGREQPPTLMERP